MAVTYTPGLYVTEKTLVEKERMLPLPGEVVVEQGMRVGADDVVARTELPGAIRTLNLASRLGVEPARLKEFLLVEEGGEVREGEVFAETKPPLGLKFLEFMTTKVKAPITGTLQSVSTVTGQAIFQEPPIPVEVRAYVEGVVREVRPRLGVVVETVATFIQGIFGIGGEVNGELMVLVDDPAGWLRPEEVGDQVRGKVVVVGAYCPAETWHRLRQAGAAGVITGGFDDRDLKEILGYDLGVAITGTEEVGMTLVMTEGFGHIRMADKTFELLRKRNGAQVSISGATQIRAGVIRPEVIIPFPELIGQAEGSGKVHLEVPAPGEEAVGEIHGEAEQAEQKLSQSGVGVGSVVRVIREPYFGRLGKIVAMPPELRSVESEARVRVFEIEFEDGTRAIVPRANVEAITE